jgi:hypothetical protein
VPGSNFFLFRLNNIPLQGYITFYLCTYP